MPRSAKGILCFYFTLLCFSSFSEYNLMRKRAKRSEEGNEGEQANSSIPGPYRKYYVLQNHPDDESVDEL